MTNNNKNKENHENNESHHNKNGSRQYSWAESIRILLFRNRIKVSLPRSWSCWLWCTFGQSVWFDAQIALHVRQFLQRWKKFPERPQNPIRDVTNVAIPARGAPGAEGATGQISTDPLTIQFAQHLKSNGAKTSNQRDADEYAVAISKEYSKSVWPAFDKHWVPWLHDLLSGVQWTQAMFLQGVENRAANRTSKSPSIALRLPALGVR